MHKLEKLQEIYLDNFLERHSYWKSLVNKNNDLTPYLLRHG